MISVFKRLVLPRFYWGCAWSGRKGKFCLKPVKSLFHIGKLCLYLTIYYKHNDKYKEKALEYLRKYIKIKEEHHNTFTVYSCYSKQDDSYIGSPEDVNIYLNTGIQEFFRAQSSDKVASIGWAPKQSKWYGWNHRAIYGFGIGYIVKKDSLVRSSGWIEGCKEYEKDEKTKPAIGFITETLGDCRYLAIRFAGAVG